VGAGNCIGASRFDLSQSRPIGNTYRFFGEDEDWLFEELFESGRVKQDKLRMQDEEIQSCCC